MESHGALRIDADRLGHEVLRQEEVRSRLHGLWGDRILNAQGEIDREQVGKLVFGDAPEATMRRRQLESIVHPRIRALAQARIAAVRAMPEPVLAIVIDAPLLLEAGWESFCDLIVFVESPMEDRLARALARGWTAEHFADREASQLAIDEKRKRATHIVHNSQSSSENGNVASQVKQIWQQQLERQVRLNR